MEEGRQTIVRLPYSLRPDFKVGRAEELSGKDRVLYRFLEILPGAVSWLTLIGVVFASMYAPVFAAYFIIAFSLYWLLKTIFLSAHLRHNWRHLRHHMKLDWKAILAPLPHDHIYHLVLFPFYKEPEEVLEATINSLYCSDYRNDRMIVILPVEARAGESALANARRLEERWKGKFAHFLVSVHPADIPGEMAGKGSNVVWAIEKARVEILDRHNIPYDDVLVSNLDSDTVVYPQYFNCLTWHFLTAEKPHKTSFQPVPIFNNNVWDAPAISRVTAMSSTFWEMIQQERPERMATFSSHSVSFRAVYEIGYWQVNMVNEDSRIYWNLLVANNGDYSVTPLSYPLSMDANVAPTLLRTIKNIYLQHRRWTYGVENFVYIAYHFIKNKQIPRGKRLRILLTQAEGYWSLVTNPIMLFLLGWLPLFLGGRAFHETVLSYNLPIVVRNLLILAMLGLVVSSMISLTLLPQRPHDRSRFIYVVLALQWILVPITMIFFSALPGLDAQTRLMLGKYLGFWVTPKTRPNVQGAPSPVL
ncbi:glycosyltransferase family 2 protein [Candidatus Kaiserbacteria bacterium]|nr:glycosyltransferase family 2 protein [Candidatus Kaiserbacteria bacterium]